MNKLEIPKPETEDYVHGLIKGIIGVVPGTAPLIELWNVTIASPMQEKQKRFMEDVAEILNAREKETYGIVEKVLQDEEFQSILHQATFSVLKTHQKEKIKLLKNALYHSVGNKFNYDRKKAFLDFIDELSPIHVKILNKFREQKGNRNVVFENSFATVYDRLIFRKPFEPEPPEIDFDTFVVAVKDLKDRRLLQVSDDIQDDDQKVQMQISRVLEASEGDKTLPFFAVTSRGIDFLMFVADYDQEKPKGSGN